MKIRKKLTVGILNNYCENLTDINFKYDPAIGRDKELEKLMLTILTPQKSALLIGKAGVGKTSIVEGLAYRISNNNVPKALKDFTIYKTSAAILISGCIYSGMLEKRIIDIFEALKNQSNTILFIDEIHTLIGTGKSNDQNTLDIANIIKPYITNENIYLIGATTDYEYKYYIKEDPAFSRRFSTIIVEEPKGLVLEKILTHTLYKYSKMYNIKIDKKLVDVISVYLTNYTNKEYINDMYDNDIVNPDLAISIIAYAYGYARLYDKKAITFDDFIHAYNMCDKVNKRIKSSDISYAIKNYINSSNIIQFKQIKRK